MNLNPPSVGGAKVFNDLYSDMPMSSSKATISSESGLKRPASTTTMSEPEAKKKVDDENTIRWGIINGIEQLKTNKGIG